MSLSLRIYPPLLVDTGSALDITGDVLGWRRSIRGRGGYWQGDFTLVGPEKDLARLFYEYLGGHFEERSNGNKTWEGMVYEMDLTYATPKGKEAFVVTRRRSLDLLYNYINGKWTDQSGNTGTLTLAKTDASITRYGRKEEYLLINGMKQTPANARRDSFLKEHNWPWARVVSVSPTAGQDQAVLDVSLAGYIATANWRYRTAGDGTDGNVSDYIKALITTDCATFLTAGKISSNTLQATKGANTPIRAGDLIFNLVDLGDSSGNPWWLYVTNDRKVVYEIIPETPRYYLHSGKIFASAGGSVEVNPWTVQPGVFRDLTYPVQKTELGGWLDDARDFYVSEVEVGTGNGLVLKTEIFEESEILAAQAEYKAQMSGGPGKKDKKTTNWKRKWDIPVEEWGDFDPSKPGFWERKQARIKLEKGKKNKKG